MLTLIGQPVVLPGPPPGRPKATVIWDVDGTLVLGDTLLPFLRRLTGTPRLTGILLRHLARPRPRSLVKAAVLREVLAGRSVARVETQARAYVADLVLRRVRPDCLRRWQWHRAQGHRLVLASASLGLYLHQLGALLGADEVISTEMAIAAGRLTGELATANCRGTEKARRAARYLAANPADTVWVYANGPADRPLRELADVAVHVRPFRTLPRIAR